MFQRHIEIQKEIDSVLSTIDDNLFIAFNRIVLSSKKIVIVGAGRVGLTCRGFAMRLAHLGLNSYFYGDMNLPAIGADDLLVIASGSGETKSMLLIAELAKSNGASIALITGRRGSSIQKLANITLNFKGASKIISEDGIKSIQPLTTLNEQCFQIIFDCSVQFLMTEMGESSDSMWKRHMNLE